MKVKKSKLAIKKDTQTTETSISKKTLLTCVAIVLVVAVIGTLLMIWQFADFTVARINNIPIRHSEVAREINASMSEAMGQGLLPGTETFDRFVREDAVRHAALEKLFMDYARQLGLSFSAGATMEDVERGVISAILTDPAAFGRYADYMTDDFPVPSDWEATAADVLARARAGEDFDALMWEYSQDPGLVGNPDGYTFVPGQFIAAFEEATRNLEYGEISDLVWAVHGGRQGYHIIKRIPPPNPPANLEEGAELFGAKHILIQEDAPLDVDTFRAQAIITGFWAKVDTGLRTLSALDRVPVSN